MSSTQPARGMRDSLPDDVRRRNYVVGVIGDVYERYGFEPLETPALENIETLLGKYGEEGNKLIFKVLKRGEHEASGEADLALRYDLTVPLARVMAEYQATLPRLFKRYQVQPVWRADRPARGRFREFYQCDIDAIGSRSPVIEAELCAAASEVLARLGFDDFEIRLNHRQLLTALLGSVPPAKHDAVIVLLDKMDRIGVDGVWSELIERVGLSQAEVSQLLGVFRAGKDMRRSAAGDQDSGNREVISTLIARFGQHGAKASLENLSQILDLCEKTPARGRVRIDPSLARGLSYYTGAIMEMTVPDLAGSLAGGGRYDNLIGMFLGREIPACGVSLGLERILVVMGERGMFPPTVDRAPADVMVTVWNDAAMPESLTLAAELRAHDFRVDVYPEADRIGKQIKYADSRKIPFAVILGDDERARAEVSIKDLSSGTQASIARSSLVNYLKDRIGTPRAGTAN